MLTAVLMAGGEGTRLRPITYYIPKPLIPVAGKPCIDYVLSSLAKGGVGRVIITTCYYFDSIAKHVGGQVHGMNIVYSVEDPPLGTAGGVKKVMGLVDDTFIVASGDVVADVDFKAIYDFHADKGADVTMALAHVDKPWEFGVVDLDDNGRIRGFMEKPKPSEVPKRLLEGGATVNAGIYVIEPEVMKEVPPDTFFDFSKNLFPILLNKGYKMFGIKLSGYWKDIGRPSDLIMASAHMAKRTGRADGNYLEHDVILGDKCVVEECSVYGKSSIGAKCTIKRSIIFNSTIGDNCTVIESVICGDSNIGDDVVVENSVIGRGISLNKGTKVTNGAIY